VNWRFVRANASPLLADTEAYLEAANLTSPSSETSLIGLVRQRFASDEELAEQLQDGNADALAVLFKRHAPLLYGIARRILRNDAEAEDVVQQIFLDVFRGIHQFDRGKGTFKSWLLMFAYQRTFNSRRSQMSNKFFETESFADLLVEDRQLGVAESRYFPVENSILIEQVLNHLQPRQRRTIELIYREGLTAEEVSIRTGESVRVVRHNLYRGLEKLRKAFSDQRKSITKAGSV
jgi:RNA polymerase sigma-70 factor (ECF subfamily)